MADPVLVQRLAEALREESEETPKGEGYWSALAERAAKEAARTVVVELRGQPAEPFLAVRKAHEGLAIVARAATLTGAQNAATDALEARGTGEVWVIEIKRVLGVEGV